MIKMHHWVDKHKYRTKTITWEYRVVYDPRVNGIISFEKYNKIDRKWKEVKNIRPNVLKSLLLEFTLFL